MANPYSKQTRGTYINMNKKIHSYKLYTIITQRDLKIPETKIGTAKSLKKNDKLV
jgi:hypothetical protein